MDAPTLKPNYTDKDLIKYANWRKDEEFKNFNAILEWQAKNSNAELFDNENYREPLSITASHKITIELSTGGDADGFILEFDKDDEDLIDAKYYWADWGVYEEVKLTDAEADLIYTFYLYEDASAFFTN